METCDLTENVVFLSMTTLMMCRAQVILLALGFVLVPRSCGRDMLVSSQLPVTVTILSM